MDNILNDKLMECYNISSKIVAKYKELYNIMMEHYLDDSFTYELYVSDILELVLEEYKIYNNLDFVEINMYLMAIDNGKYDESMLGFRFKRKLETLKDNYNNIKINGYILKLDMIPNDIYFSLFSSLLSLIDIEMMKRIRFKIDNISTGNCDDLSFVDYVYMEFIEYIFYKVFDNNLIEMIYLKSNMNINMVPVIDINNLICYINEILKLKNDNFFEPINTFLLELSKISIDRLLNDEFENNPSAVFSFLMFITKLEVLVDYMDKDCLISLLNYCNNFDINNGFGIDKIVSVIKKKIK